MSIFHSESIDHGIQTSRTDAIPKREDITTELDLIEIQVRRIKRLINNDGYYSSIIDEIVTIKTGLDNITYFLLVRNIKSCIAEKLQSGDPFALDRLFITTGKVLKS